MARPLVGMQPIVFGDRKLSDPLACLDEVRDAGFVGVESVDYTDKYPLAEVKQWFCDRGLVVPATHSDYGMAADSAQLEQAMDFVNAFGGRYVIVSGTKHQTVAGYDESAEVFNRAGEQCRARGLTFCYHNHAWEFKTLDNGERGIDRLIARSDPALVGLNIDVYWVHIGGDDPAAFVRKHGERAKYFHFKDGGKDAEGRPTFAELGRGDVDLASALEAAIEVGAHWICYEQDRTELPHFEALSISRECLRSLGV